VGERKTKEGVVVSDAMPEDTGGEIERVYGTRATARDPHVQEAEGARARATKQGGRSRVDRRDAPALQGEALEDPPDPRPRGA